MLLLRLINYIKGFILIQIEGNFLEKFINISARRGMFFWDIERSTSKTLKLKISIKDFKRLRPVARKSKCKVKILKKHGMPFILFRYRRRKVFLIGVVFFIVLFYIMTSFIWAIEITGDEVIDKDILIKKLEENGVRNGSLKYIINYDDLSKKILLEMKEYSWIGIHIKGTKLKLEVEKSIEKPNIISKNEPCNLVSSHDGIIVSLTLKFGEQRVAVGDTITKGQTLISGEIISKNPNEAPRFVNALGLIKARTWYEEEEMVETKIPYKERTGKDKKVYSFIFFSKKITITPGKMKFTDYDLETKSQKLSFGENLVLPFEIIVDTYDENVIKYKEIDIEEAKNEAYQKALSNAYSKLSASAVILNTDCEFKQNNDGQMKVNVIIECIEDIGVEQKIK